MMRAEQGKRAERGGEGKKGVKWERREKILFYFIYLTFVLPGNIPIEIKKR